MHELNYARCQSVTEGTNFRVGHEDLVEDQDALVYERYTQLVPGTRGWHVEWDLRKHSEYFKNKINLLGFALDV